MEVNTDNIKYRKASNLEGPVYTVDKSMITLHAKKIRRKIKTAPFQKRSATLTTLLKRRLLFSKHIKQAKLEYTVFDGTSTTVLVDIG